MGIRSLFNNKIRFFPEPGHESIIEAKELHPQPAGRFIPKWLKSIEKRRNTIKDCPVIPEYMSQGYIIPMWCDLYLKSENGLIIAETPDSGFRVDSHPPDQFLGYTNNQNTNIHGVAKLICPWLIRTPKNWGVYQVPTFYHFNDGFSVMPGSIRTDSYHTVNQQVMIHKEKDWVYIERGTPIVQYIPYKREKIKHSVNYMSPEDQKSYKRYTFLQKTKFFNSYKLNR